MLKIFDIALKDLVRSSRSMFLLGMTLAAPVLITALIYLAFGSMKSGDASMAAVKVGIVNADQLPSGAPIRAPLGDSVRAMFFDESVQSWIEAQDFASEAEARDAVNRQEIGAAVIIPAEFTTQYLADSRSTPITILQDPTLSIGPTVVKEMVISLLDGVAGGGIAYKTVDARMQAAGLQLASSAASGAATGLIEKYSTWYQGFQRDLFHNPDKAALVQVSPVKNGQSQDPLQSMMGLILAGQMIFFSFFTGAYAMQSILLEDEEGTLARLFTTPTERTLVLSGKFLAVLLTVLIQGLTLMTVGVLLFKVNWGNPLSAALSLFGQMVASVGLGVLLIAFVKTTRQTGPVLGGALTGLGMLSGLFTTNINMPASFNAIGSFTPQGWVLKAWKLSLAGQPPAELLTPFLVLMAIGLVLFVIGAVLFRRRYA